MTAEEQVLGSTRTKATVLDAAGRLNPSLTHSQKNRQINKTFTNFSRFSFQTAAGTGSGPVRSVQSSPLVLHPVVLLTHMFQFFALIHFFLYFTVFD